MNPWLVANSPNYESVASMFNMDMNFIVYPELPFYTEDNPIDLSFEAAENLFKVTSDP